MKKAYDKAELEILYFSAEDVVVTSGDDGVPDFGDGEGGDI